MSSVIARDAKSPLTKTLAGVFALAGMYPVALVSPLVYDAIARDDKDRVLRLLGKCPAALWPQNEDEVAPFKLAVMKDHAAVAAAMAKSYPHLLKDRDDAGRPLLQQVACGTQFQPRHVDLVVSLGADPGGRDDSGQTALHWAFHDDMVAALLQNGVPVNAASVNGRTALMVAAAQGETQVVERLLAHGTELHPVDARGLNATMQAIRAHETGAAALLLDKGGTIDLNDPAVETALRVATEEMDTGFLKAIGRLRGADEALSRAHIDSAGNAMHDGIANDMTVRPLRLQQKKAGPS